MRIAPLEINTHYKHSSPLWHLNYFIITMRLQMWKAWRFHHRVHPIKVSCFLFRDEKRNNCNFTTRKSKKYRKYFITKQIEIIMMFFAQLIYILSRSLILQQTLKGNIFQTFSFCSWNLIYIYWIIILCYILQLFLTFIINRNWNWGKKISRYKLEVKTLLFSDFGNVWFQHN